MRVLHVLDFSLPKTQSGYSIRSQYIVCNQRALGLQPAVVTRDTVWVPGPSRPLLVEETLDGVRYFREPALAVAGDALKRLQAAPGFGEVYGPGLTRRFRKLIARAVRAHRPNVIHAASPDVVGLWASDVARAFGLPLVYEVRGLWHETAVAMGRLEAGSPAYEKMSATFVEALKRADAIVTLSETVKAEIERAGIPADSVYLVPNGVDADRFAPRERPADLARQLGIAQDEVVLGYVGSLRPFEGLDLVLKAVRKLRDDGLPVKAVFAGRGESLDELKALASSLDLDGIAHFTGEVSHEQASDYVALLDVVTMPRTRSRVTELVTPIKPFEALACGKAVVVSDVAALREIVTDGETGLVCRAGDVADLAKACARLVRDPALRRQLGQRGRAWVEAERTWRLLAGRYPDIYRAATERCGRSPVYDDRIPRRVILLQPLGDSESDVDAVAEALSEDDRVDLVRLSDRLGPDEAHQVFERVKPDCLLVPSFPFDPWISADQVTSLVEAARDTNPDVDVFSLIGDGSVVPVDPDAGYYNAVCPVLYSLFDGVLDASEAGDALAGFPWVSDIVVPVVRKAAGEVGEFVVGLQTSSFRVSG